MLNHPSTHLCDICPHPQGGEKSKEEELGEERYPSVVPLLPPLTDKTITKYLRFYLSALATIIVFGGLLAPTLEVHLGLGGACRLPEFCGQQLLSLQ